MSAVLDLQGETTIQLFISPSLSLPVFCPSNWVDGRVRFSLSPCHDSGKQHLPGIQKLGSCHSWLTQTWAAVPSLNVITVKLKQAVDFPWKRPSVSENSSAGAKWTEVAVTVCACFPLAFSSISVPCEDECCLALVRGKERRKGDELGRKRSLWRVMWEKEVRAEWDSAALESPLVPGCFFCLSAVTESFFSAVLIYSRAGLPVCPSRVLQTSRLMPADAFYWLALLPVVLQHRGTLVWVLPAPFYCPLGFGGVVSGVKNYGLPARLQEQVLSSMPRCLSRSRFCLFLKVNGTWLSGCRERGII